jgi:uncharacterized protein YecE (DUF72 family)
MYKSLVDFGKLFNVDRIDFTLPPEDPRTTELLGPAASRRPVQVFSGGPVWTCPKWMGKVYPHGTASRDYLHAYGLQFNSIELNSTFYQIPSHEQVRKWKNAVPSDFRFAPKFFQGISHAVGDLPSARSNLKMFWESVCGFEEKLGICFLQLPPHFDSHCWGFLERLILDFPEPSRLAIEFRHPTWFTERRLQTDAYDFLKAHGVSTVITDVAGRRDVLHSSLTTRKVLIRFTGNELHPSDFTRLDSWIDRLGSWVDRGIEEIYFYIHQPTEQEVPELLKEFVDKMNIRCGLSLRGWSPVEKQIGFDWCAS